MSAYDIPRNGKKGPAFSLCLPNMLRHRRSSREASHSRSNSYPESINLSLLSFSCSLTPIPSLASQSTSASLSTVSFPRNTSDPTESPKQGILPLNDNLLLLSPPDSPDGLSSNQSFRFRTTITAPTPSRLKHISKESSCITKWMLSLPDSTKAPGHSPWAGAKVAKELEWIPEGSMYSPERYSKDIAEMRSRQSRYEADAAISTLGSKPVSALSTTLKPSGLPIKSSTKRVSQRSPIPHRRATNVKPPSPPQQRHDKTKTKKAENERLPPRGQDTRSGSTKIPRPPQTPLAQRDQPSRKRKSIATFDMINALRGQCATLTVQTPPPDQLDHSTESPPAAAAKLPSTIEQEERLPSLHETYGGENDFGSRLSTLYPTATVKMQPELEGVTLTEVHFRPESAPITTDSRSSVSSDDIQDADVSTHANISVHRRQLSQMFRSSRFYSSKSGGEPKISLSTVPRKKGVVTDVTVKKEVRFAPLPTTMRRYPPGPSDSGDSELGDSSLDFFEYEPLRPRGPAVRRPKPQSPWLPSLEKGPRATVSTISHLPSLSLKASAMDLASPASSSSLKPVPLGTSPPGMRPIRSKQSFARRSLSKIMKIETIPREKPNRPVSFGFPSLQSHWSIDENGARRDDDPSLLAAKSRIPLPRLRLGNIFSRFTSPGS